MAVLTEDRLVVADTSNGVLRVLRGVDQSGGSIEVSTVCHRGADHRAVDITGAYDLRSYSPDTCLLSQPIKVYVSGKVLVIDEGSDRAKVLSYSIVQGE